MTPLDIQALAIDEAKRAGEILNIPWEYIYGQWAYESTSGGYHFGSGLAMNNLNLAGIKRFYSGGRWEWRKYNSVRDFTDDYIKLIQDGYPNVPGSQTIDNFSDALANGKWGSWFGHKNYSSYAAGIKARIDDLGDMETAANTKAGPPLAPGFKSGGTIAPYEKTWWEKIKDKAGLTTKPGQDSLDDIIDARKNYGLDTTDLEEWRDRKQPGGIQKIKDGFQDISGMVNKSLYVIAGLGLLIAGFVIMNKTDPGAVINESKGG